MADPGDVVGATGTKRRPPVVVSSALYYQHRPDLVLGVLTSQVSRATTPLDFPIGGFSPPEGRLARGFKPPAFSRFLFQSAVKSAESF